MAEGSVLPRTTQDPKQRHFQQFDVIRILLGDLWGVRRKARPAKPMAKRVMVAHGRPVAVAPGS